MELEQLVSFVRYQRGQKQGWDMLDEVLTIVLESQERVASNEKAAAQTTQAIEEMRLSLVSLDKTREDKLVALDAELAAKVESFQSTLKTSKDALQAEINQLEGVRQGAVTETATALSAEVLAKESLSRALDETKAAEAELARVRSTIAELKASL